MDGHAKARPDAVSVGELWLLRVIPVAGGQSVKDDQLRIVTVSGDEENAALALCTLGVGKGAEGRPELLVYGKDD
jgi:hypothetical protein